MKIDIQNQQGVPIELHRVVNGVTVKNSPVVPVEVKKKQITVEPQQQPNVALAVVNKVAFGSGIVIVKTEQEYTDMWMANKLNENRWYVLYSEKHELLKVWMGYKLFARKGEEGETKSNVFPLRFPIVF